MAKLSAPNRRNVRRSLFGPLTTDDKLKVDKWLNERFNEISKENMEKSKYWGFDFDKGVPLSTVSSISCDYQWIECPCYQVPTFYCSKNDDIDQVAGSIPNGVIIAGGENAASTSSSFLASQQQQQQQHPDSADLLKNLMPKENAIDPDIEMTTPLKPTETSQNVTAMAPPPVQPKPKMQHQTQLSDFYRTKRGSKRSARTSLSPKFTGEDQSSSLSSTDSASPLSVADDDDDDDMDEGYRKMSRFDKQPLPSAVKNNNTA